MTLEYDAENRWLIHTEQLGPEEYGASAIFAENVSPVWAARILASLAATRLSLRMRLGPFPNELDAVRSFHRRQDVATPDDHVEVICATCYILDEGWPCTVARLIDVLDVQIAAEEVAARVLS